MNPIEEESLKSQRAVQSVEVGGRLLLALAASPEPMLLKELAAKAGLPSSRAHPYLVSFGRLGFVRQDGDGSGRYALGSAALQMGLTALHQLEPLQVARPIAEVLAAETAQAVAVAVWGNLGPTVIRMIDAVHPLHVAMRAGTVMSPFGTATGRAFAGVVGSEQIADAMAGMALGFEDAPRTFDVRAYDGQIQEARDELRQHGCTRAVGKPIPGVNAFSAPIFDHERRPVLVLTLLGREDLVSASWESPMAQAVKDSAQEASRQLGHRP
ncbi:IclR family transcriptional regulator [Variovorax terrae]|uniref:IclR family transcriptional regulator n=1 Tax=Variovorax terrae TaxID=2923278 RepID=A0A9X1VZJ9_9BURK|nr:IclR family transcriptional regulator [Variovorax terrae]MCJ0766168.1 IclR family transcriptional regulator [Variovorax terrae]